jgi:glucose uptake protein GlcU
MDRLIEFANNFSDTDRNWWPILRLRPGKDEKMTNSLVGMLALFYGLTGSVSLYLLLKALGRIEGFSALLILSIVFVVGGFILYRVSFAYSWNRRADTLQADASSYQE